MYPFLSLFSSSCLGLFCVSCSPAFFLTCQFYDGGIPMSTTFPFYRAKQTHNSCFTHHHHPQYINNSLLLLLQLSIHTITIIHPHLIGISPLHCHSISFPFSVATFEHYFVAWRFFFCNQSSAAITLIFDPFLFWYSTSQRNLPHYHAP